MIKYIPYAIILILIAIIAWLLWHPQNKTNQGASFVVASSSVKIPEASVTIKYVYVKVPSGSQVPQPIVSLPVAAHTASMTISGEFFRADILYQGSASVADNVYRFDDKLSETHTETGQVMKPLTLWDYLWQYLGWILLGADLMLRR